ncbi:MAG: PKD domain-containing protein, partial [Ferruginibacter sp.]
SSPQTVTYTISPSNISSGVQCNGASFNVVITVNPNATISNTPLTQIHCTSIATDSVVWTSLSANTNFAWQLISSGSITGFLNNGNGNLPSMQLFNTGDVSSNLVYAVTTIVDACPGNATNYTFTVHPDAKATFTYPKDTACWPFNIIIQNTSLPTRNGNYNWYANNVLIGSGINFPGHTIVQPGDSVEIKMVAISLYGCKNDSISHWFFTKLQPHPIFELAPRDSCGPIQVRFTNQTPYLDTFKYLWTFGNGTSSTLAHPLPVTYQPSPLFVDTTYHITLAAYNECDTVYFRDSVIVHAKPKARFGVQSTSGCSPFTVFISNTSIGNYNSVYYWDFGNGDKDTTYAIGNLQYTYYVSNTVDTFPLRLIAMNACGSDTMLINIRVAPNTIRPILNINADQLFGCAPHTVHFVNSSLGATQFTWDFGDGSQFITSDTLTPVAHTYINAGTYTVQVNLTNGCSDTSASMIVVVYPKIIPNFSVSPVFCLGDSVRVTNLSQNATNYIWYWGDGQSSAGFEPVHHYSTAGIYNIQLLAQRT